MAEKKFKRFPEEFYLNLNFEFKWNHQIFGQILFFARKHFFILSSDELQKSERESYQDDQRAVRREGDSFQSVVFGVVRREVA